MSTKTGSAIYFDGRSSARHDVTVMLDPAKLQVHSAEGMLLAEWPYGEIEELSSHEGMLRIGLYRSADLTRLEIHDPAFAHTIDELAVGVDRTGERERRSRRRVIIWAVAATVSLFLTGVYGVPAIADRVAPLLPYAVDAQLGAVVDAQLRATSDKGDFACDVGANGKAGRDALDILVGKLQQAAAYTGPLKITVVRNTEPNAIALPGGIIYVYQGLIEKSEGPDGLAGVIAHEFGHVVNRDGTRRLLKAGALTFLFGMVLGDFVGGGAVIMASRTILENAFTREQEAAADRYAIALMNKMGADTRAFGRLFDRIGGAIEPGVKILQDHPEIKERVDVINASANPQHGPPLLDATQWAALRRICGAQ